MALTLAPNSTRQSNARQRYVSDAVKTHTPERLVTMLFDKLVSELDRAEIAMRGGDLYAANDALVRSQAIVLELRASLRLDVWDGAKGLASLYDFFVREIIQANVSRDPARIATTRILVEPIRDAFHQAAAEVLAGQAG